MARGKYEGASAFLFDTPEDHKQFALMLIGEGVAMSDATRAIGRVMLADVQVRRKIITLAKQMREARGNDKRSMKP